MCAIRSPGVNAGPNTRAKARERACEAWRMGGQIVTWISCWYHQWLTILLGALMVIAAWMFGLVRPRSEIELE